MQEHYMQRLRISTAFSIDHQLRGCAFGAVDVEAGECGGGSEYSNHFNLGEKQWCQGYTSDKIINNGKM
jgi:hypothetical protein